MKIERVKLLAKITNLDQRILIIEMLDNLCDEIQLNDSFESPAYKKAVKYKEVILKKN